MQYDIFISYRRDGGDIIAHILYDRLTQKGYSVFQDIEALQSGKFNLAIYNKIEQCHDVILILSQGSLERCVEQDDWLRKEIICAIRNKKNIIPVMLRNFEWPSKLPNEINEIRFYNGITVNTEYFEQFIEKLTHFFITPHPSQKSDSFKQKHLIRTLMMTGLILLTFCFPLFVTFVFEQSFNLFWRILYFCMLVALARLAIYEIKTRPEIASACFGSLVEKDLNMPPDVVFSRITSAFGKNILISQTEAPPFISLYTLKRLILGTWDGKKTNYTRVIFRRKLEWYTPSIFHLYTPSTEKEALKMLTRQGFILHPTPAFSDSNSDYLVKGDFHIFLHYKKSKVDYVEVYLCTYPELTKYYKNICEVIKHYEKISKR